MADSARVSSFAEWPKKYLLAASTPYTPGPMTIAIQVLLENLFLRVTAFELQSVP